MKRAPGNEELLRRIDERMQRLRDEGRRVTDRGISLAAGLKPDAVRNIRRGWEPRPSVLSALARVLGCKPSYLVDASEGARPGVAEAAAAYKAAPSGLHPGLRAFLDDIAARLARRDDEELLRLYAFLAQAHRDWTATGRPFDAVALLTSALEFFEMGRAPSQRRAGVRQA